MSEIIGISGKQFAGKDLLADMLIEMMPEYRKVPLAKAIKEEFARIYGLTPHDIEANKALYRSGLIALGQRRRQADPNYWLKQVLGLPGPKIISDVRLKHEYEILKSQGAFMIRLDAERKVREGRGKLVQEQDLTECELDDVTGWDAVLTNNDTKEALKKQIETLNLATKIR